MPNERTDDAKTGGLRWSPARSMIALVLMGGLAVAVDGQGAARGQAPAVATPPAITPEEAAAHAGERCVVTLTVNSARLMDDAARCYLNSHDDFRDDRNFTAVIFKRGLEAFAGEGITDPVKHFRGKTIRVTGTVELYKDKPQIKVDRPDQIEIVPEASGDAGRRGQD